MGDGIKRIAEINVFEAKPRPQGSKRHVGNGRMIEQSEHVGPYREAIRLEAATQMIGKEVVTGPVRVLVQFCFKRPKSHYRGNTGELADHAPRTYAHGMKRGDIDKLERAIFDAMTGVVYKDDRLVVSVEKEVLACEFDATLIAVYEVEA